MDNRTEAFIQQHTTSDDVTLASALVEEAGSLATQMRSEGVRINYKTSISDVVTEADRAAEKFVATVLQTLRPEDGMLGEEGASQASTSGRTWVIDPVDGTYNFASGSDYFCSALALAEGGTPLLGAVHRPVLSTTWIGGSTLPTRCNGISVAKLKEAPARQLSIGTYLHPSWMENVQIRDAWLAAVGEFATLRMFGAGSVDLAGVATGQLGAWMQHSVADWDWLPGKALVEGVGGTGVKVDAGGVTWCLAGNKEVVAEIADLLTQRFSA